jgi:23S rRNA pseudouridine955/2504/2580 synthase
MRKPACNSALTIAVNFRGGNLITCKFNALPDIWCETAQLLAIISAMKKSESPPQKNTVLSVAHAAVHASVAFYTVDEELVGQRLDNFLMVKLKGVPKSRIYNLIRKGEVRVNKGRTKPDYKLQLSDVVRTPPVRQAEKATDAQPQASHQMQALLNNSILFENDGMLVINKPAGLAVHGGSGVSLGLIETLRQMRPDARYLELVHRLDRDTSGCIMVAKKRSFLRHLQAALRDKSTGDVVKIYHALVVGAWSKRCEKVDAPLLRMEVGKEERIVKVNPQGKPSLTRYKILQAYQGATLVEARPITGRTHQIRVHSQYASHSLVGDEKYGNDDDNTFFRRLGVKRLFLHAATLGFNLPGESDLTWVNAPLPSDLSIPLSRLSPL